MAVEATDIKWLKSATVTDTAANGGRKGNVEIQTGVRHNLFPRVTKTQRAAGLTRCRKEFWANRNADDDAAEGVLIFPEFPSPAGDRFYFGKGTQTDTQADLTDYDPVWVGVGQLETALSGGETSVSLTMEHSDFQWPNGGTLHLADKVKTGQTIASGVKKGDSVEYNDGTSTWEKIAATSDVDYPKGICVGSTSVLTVEGTTNEEFLALADNEYTDEDIGDGDGADTSPTLSTLTNATNGICRQPGKLPVVTATDTGDATMTVNVAADGTCSGDCSAGELNMEDGTWTTDITWTTAPKNGTDITITYRENCFSYSGNVVTVELESGSTVANSYTTAKTYGAGCVDGGTVEPESENWAETSTSGTYDESTYPVILYNDGTEEDSITITFSSASAFTASGANAGSLGSGQITENFSPTNPDTGQPYFTVDADGWGGSWANGETVEFDTHPSAVGLWLKEVVPAATSQESHNTIIPGFYCE
ncbi:MAG: hypothetical protein PVG49_16020 [Desulfobacteraceae bacterium]|jgi:hypothetical protein